MFQELSAIVINCVFFFFPQLFSYLHNCPGISFHHVSTICIILKLINVVINPQITLNTLRMTRLRLLEDVLFNSVSYLQMQYILYPLGVRRFQRKFSKMWPWAGWWWWSLVRRRDCINMTLCTHQVNYLNICLAIRRCAKRVSGTAGQRAVFLFVVQH